MSALATSLQAWFTDRLIRERNASPHTIASYRDTIRLLLTYASQERGVEPSSLDLGQLDAPLIGAFLDHLETDRGCGALCRSRLPWFPLRAARGSGTGELRTAICESRSVSVALPSFGGATSMSPLALAPRSALTGPARSPLPSRQSPAGPSAAEAPWIVFRRMGDNRGVTGACSALRESGFVWIRSALATPTAAFAKSRELIEGCAASNGHDAPSVIGDFILPPPDGETTRDFQTLHFDFGVPLRPLRDQDVARYTALFIPRSAVRVTAVTRLVPLDALLGQRRWPDRATLLDNLIAYGESHGAWDAADGYCEGSMGRVVEAAAGAPRLPSVTSTPGFLCGMEFDNLAAEVSFFKCLGLDVDAVQVEVPLRPGDLLVFDNLALAHGRRGSRRPGELHQRIYGQRSLSPAAQRGLRDRFLAVFGEPQLTPPRPAVSMP